MALSPEAFVKKYKSVTANEKAAVQTHFNELCELLQVPKPLDYDPAAKEYRFEKPVNKVTGKKGFADVWWLGRFGWEYKGPEVKNLNKAYLQLLEYREDLQNPPLMVVSDMRNIEVHTNFTSTQKEVTLYTLDDLLDEAKRRALAQVWNNPQAFNPARRIEIATEAAMADLDKLSTRLRVKGIDSDAIAHFLVRIMFTLFAESVKLLPEGTFTRLLTEAQKHPEDFKPMCEELFAAMKTGKKTLAGRVPYINGGVFEKTSAPELTLDEVNILREAARRNWRQIDPTIFGSLFELVLDPKKRWELGAHYTPMTDILDVIEPVIMRPLLAEWNALKNELVPLIAEVETARQQEGGGLFAEGGLGQSQIDTATHKLRAFQKRLSETTVLDAAMGSGNFLYIALRRLLDLELSVRATLANLTGRELSTEPPLVSPKQFLGMEINEYAHEIASMVLWIGYLQWLREHNEKFRLSPVLDKLPGLLHQDAVMDGKKVREWPAAEFIVGNPPFLGYSPMRVQLGSAYVDSLRSAYEDRIPGFSDFVCYWFDKAREQVKSGHTKRVGLIATNSIRGGKNRLVLERIQKDASIFRAWPDRAWTQDGAAVRVSVVMFDDGTDDERVLLHHEGDERNIKTRTSAEKPVSSINPDLSTGAALETAQQLRENTGRAFIGVVPGGEFDIPGNKAREWIPLPNPSGVSNADVLKRYVVGEDITEGNKDRYTVDFNGLTETQAAEYEEPMAHVLSKVKPEKLKTNEKHSRESWWLYKRTAPDMRAAIAPLSRFLGTSRVSKFRTFAWLPTDAMPGDALVVFAVEDDFMYGVLNSHLHGTWAARKGTFMGVGNDPRYTPSTIFETFPFPTQDTAQQEVIAKAAKHLEAMRIHLLKQEEPDRKADTKTSHIKKLLTLTGVYNLLTSYRKNGKEVVTGVAALDRAHTALDAAVAAAYGWAWPLTDDELLKRLLALNLERAAIEHQAAELMAAQEVQRKENEKAAKVLARTQAAAEKVAQKAAAQLAKAGQPTETQIQQ